MVLISRRQKEAEFKLLEEELARRVEEAIRKNVEERLNSDEVKLDIKRRIEEGIRKLFDEVDAQLQREKEAALYEARQKAVSLMRPLCFLLLIIVHNNTMRFSFN